MIAVQIPLCCVSYFVRQMMNLTYSPESNPCLSLFPIHFLTRTMTWSIFTSVNCLTISRKLQWKKVVCKISCVLCAKLIILRCSINLQQYPEDNRKFLQIVTSPVH